MSNIALGSDDRAAAGSYSGGSWVAGLPLSNLSEPEPTLIARSTDATVGSTQFVLDFGYDAPVELLVLGFLNATDAATVRMRLGPNADGSSAELDVALTAGDFGSYVSSVGRLLPYLHTTQVHVRYAFVEITDTANPDGYVDLSLFRAGPVFQPEFNVSNANLEPVDPGVVSYAEDRTRYVDRAPLRWRLSGEFPALSESEAHGSASEMKRICGLTEPLIVMLNPELTDDRLARTVIYGVFTTLEPCVVREPTVDAVLFGYRFAVEEFP